MINVSKLLLISILLLTAMLIGCTKEGPMGPGGPQGEQGNTGPAGPQGEQGEPGVNGIDGVDGTDGEDGTVISYLGGVVSLSHYVEFPDYITIENTIIPDSSIVQFYVSPDKNTTTWGTVEHWEFGEGVIYAWDPGHLFLGWDFLIMIIEQE